VVGIGWLTGSGKPTIDNWCAIADKALSVGINNWLTAFKFEKTSLILVLLLLLLHLKYNLDNFRMKWVEFRFI